MAIITLPLPNVFSNGTTADATQVNADLNQITANVNANAAELAVLATTAGAALIGAVAATNNSGSVQTQLTNVGSATGTTRVGFTSAGTGAIATTAAAKFQQLVLSITDFAANGVSGAAVDVSGAVDSYLGIQAADTYASSVGATLFFPKGSFKQSAAINKLTGSSWQGVKGKSTFILATQNMNGIVVGDGTAGPFGTTAQTFIDGLSWNPLPGIAAFASGSCIYLNTTSYVHVTNCTFYGLDVATKKLFNGVKISASTECWVTDSYFISLLGVGLDISGTSAATPGLTADGRFDRNEFTAVVGDCVLVGDYVAGCTFNWMIAFNYTTWAIHFAGTGVAANSLYYIDQPDFEADGASGSIYCQYGANFDINAGWISGQAAPGAVPALWCGANAGRVKVTGTQVLKGRIQVDAPSCTFTGVDCVGDNATAASVGYVISSTGTDCSITGGKVQQHFGAGIQFSSTAPASGANINGVSFKGNGPSGTSPGYSVVGSTGLPGSILGASGGLTHNSPRISGCISDISNSIASAASIIVDVGRQSYQVTGTTQITTITPLGEGSRITLQPTNAAGCALAGGGNILLKTSPTTIPQFSTMSLNCFDGVNWFEDGRNF